MKDDSARGLRYLTAGAFSFSLMAALAKVGGVGAIPLFELVLARSVVVALLAGGTLLKSGASFRGREPGLLLVRALLGFAGLTCFYFSVIELPLADATVIFFTNPVWTAVIAALVIGELMGPRELALVLLSLVGVVLVARPAFVFGSGAALDLFAVAVGLAGAVFAAGAYVTVRRLRRERPMLIVFWFGAISSVLSLPLVLRDPVMPSGGMWLVLLGLGLTTHLGQVLITWGFRLERAGRASAVGYLQIVFAAGWGWLLFSEVPDAWTWVGAAVVAASTVSLARMRPVR